MPTALHPRVGQRVLPAALAALALLGAGCSTTSPLRGAAGAPPTTRPTAEGPPAEVTTTPSPSAPPGPSPDPSPVAGSTPPVAAPGTCHVRGSGVYVLPDPRCTPGARNPAVTQATIHTTICRSGFSKAERPPAAYTEQLKRSGMAAYGDTGRLSTYEEDHLVSLELGGSPTDPANLWPQPGASPNLKDAVEDAAHTAVCGGSLTLADAQGAVASDWIALGHRLGVTPASVADPGPGHP